MRALAKLRAFLAMFFNALPIINTMKINNKRAITDIYAFILLIAMLLGMASILYIWIQDMEANIEQRGNVQSTGLMQATVFNVRILTMNSTNDGVVLENKGQNNVTAVTIWVDGVIVAMNLQLQEPIRANSAGLVPLNTTITGQSTDVKITAVDSQGTATTVQSILSAS